MTAKSNGTHNFIHNTDTDDMDSRRIVYRQVGTIQLMRGNRFTISLDEHRLPEGTRALYVRDLIGPSEPDSTADSSNDSGYASTNFNGW